jgi:tRNA G18 (ribose-2'-O)-methylase SpoU
MAGNEFEHVRHRPPRELARPRELLLVVPQLRSNVNLSRIARLASCSGLEKLVCEGRAKLDPKIARDAVETLRLEVHRSLPPVLRQLRSDGYRIVGLEQTSDSHNLHDYAFARRTALVLGKERDGMTDDLLAEIDDAVEIPIWGRPYSYNVATATTMAVYEYCKQFPDG